jgi:hypothetical protein
LGGNSVVFHSLYLPRPTHTILFSPILSTCPNQRNLCNLIFSVIVGF